MRDESLRPRVGRVTLKRRDGPSDIDEADASPDGLLTGLGECKPVKAND